MAYGQAGVCPAPIVSFPIRVVASNVYAGTLPEDRGQIYFSYGTPVAAVIDQVLHVTADEYSASTKRHIRKIESSLAAGLFKSKVQSSESELFALYR